MLYRIINTYNSDYMFIIGVADQVPPDGDIKRVRIVTDIIEKTERD